MPFQDYNARLVFAGTNLVSSIDEEFRALSLALQERLKNGGQYLPASDAATSGVHFPSTTHYGAGAPGRWALFRKTDGADTPNTASAILDVSDSGTGTPTVASAATWTHTGTINATALQVGGTAVVDKSANKRAYTLSLCGSLNPPDAAASANVNTMAMIVPYTGTVVEFGCASSAQFSTQFDFDLRKRTGAYDGNGFLTSDPCSAGNTTSLLSAAITMAANSYGFRKSTFADAAVAAGDTLWVSIDGNAGAGVKPGMVYVVIERAWA